MIFHDDADWKSVHLDLKKDVWRRPFSFPEVLKRLIVKPKDRVVPMSGAFGPVEYFRFI